MNFEPHTPIGMPPIEAVLAQAVADARQREADMDAHLLSQLDGPTIDDIATLGEWGQSG